MVLFTWIDSLFEWGKLIGVKWCTRLKFVVQQILTIISLFIIVLWLSIFFYACFTYSYMPATAHERPVHLRFRSDCNDYQDGILCEFPSANFSLLKESQSELLARGQKYVVSLLLEMPESPENLQHGMFMTILKFYSRYGEIVKSSSRTVLMRYKSFLHRTLETLFFIPTLLSGSAEQKQTVVVELFDNYQEDPYRPTIGAIIEIQSKRIQIYRVTMKIHASFTGLRYFLYHWPMTSAFFGICTNMAFMWMVLLVAYFNLRAEPTGNQYSEQDEKKRIIREDLTRDKAKHNTHIQYMSSSVKSKPRGGSPPSPSNRSRLNNLSTDSVMETSSSSSASYASSPSAPAEDVTFSLGSDVTSDRTGSGNIPQVRVSHYPTTGTDASDLRHRQVPQA